MSVKTKDAYRVEIEGKLKKHEANIEHLRNKTVDMTAEGRKKVDELITASQKKTNELRKQLDALQNASGNAWDELKQGAENTWNTALESMNRAIDEFKTEQSGKVEQTDLHLL